jgi:hypothetical protein
MTKIVYDPTAHQVERHAGNTMDLARRLEWRLQWEKAQVENWQTSHHQVLQQAEAAEPPPETSERGLKENYETFSQSRFASDKWSVITELRRFDQSAIYHSKLRYDSSGSKETRTQMVQTVIAPTGGEGVGRASFITAKTASTFRATPIPLCRQSQAAGVHVYQADGKVEVALRNTGLNGKDGVALMTGLKKDLASLGLRLTRLTLNGELLMQAETTPPKGLASIDRDADEMAIEKIY